MLSSLNFEREFLIYWESLCSSWSITVATACNSEQFWFGSMAGCIISWGTSPSWKDPLEWLTLWFTSQRYLLLPSSMPTLCVIPWLILNCPFHSVHFKWVFLEKHFLVHYKLSVLETESFVFCAFLSNIFILLDRCSFWDARNHNWFFWCLNWIGIVSKQQFEQNVF